MTEKKSKTNASNKIWLAIILAIISFVAFSNSLSGEFVYDDKRQIVRNPLIKDSNLYGKALTSDVWAFKGDGSIAASNYWRPTFTAWSIFNYQIFELDPFGWRVLNVLLHVGVCIFAFLLLRRFGLSDLLSFAICLIFAVHPVHVESVSWIAGSPDILLSLFLIGSFWFAKNYSERSNKLDLVFALVFYAFALGSKEVALLCLPLFWLIFSNLGDEKADDSKPSSLANLAPFVLIGVVYFFARLAVIGQLSLPAEDATGFGSALLTAPSVFVFYLKQIFFPFTLGPNYPIRAVEVFSVGGVLIPLLVSFAALFLLGMTAKKSKIQAFGFGLFLLPLLPAFNITAFVPEQIAHDRYLYLPLLGMLMMIIPVCSDLAQRFNKENSQKIVAGIALVVSVVLFVKTWSYNLVWKNDISLWTHSITVDSNSAFNFSQLGANLSEVNKTDRAIKAYNSSLDIKRTPLAYMGRARGFLAKRKYEEAIFDLNTVSEMPPEKIDAYTLYQTYEGLAIAHSQKGNLVEAENVLRAARKKLPIYYAALTGKLAVVLYQKGDKPNAVDELEKVRNQARVEMLPESKTSLFRLGALYFELEQKQKARSILKEYLQLTSRMQDKNTLGNRKQALELMKK